jgi:raffinose/stachyose/melibiose transport system permease protein
LTKIEFSIFYSQYEDREVFKEMAVFAKKSIMRSSSGQVTSLSTKVISYVILSIAAVIVLYPVFWLLMSSLKTLEELTFNTWGIPRNPQPRNFYLAWINAGLGTLMLNSVRTATLTVTFTLLACVPMAFVLSRFKFRFRRLLYFVVITGMMIPIHAAIIPLYLLVHSMGMMNNLNMLALIYGAFRIPISVFILEGYMNTIPKEMEECAYIDGCSAIQLFFSIIVPLSRDVIATVAILAVINAWNELMVAMLLISDMSLRTLPVGLAGFLSEYFSEHTQLAAGALLAVIPTLLFYLVAQERIQKGLTAGALKG